MKCIYSCCVAIGLLILTATGYSQKTDPPFNVNEVIEQVSRNRSSAVSMTGEFLLDTVRYVPASGTEPAVGFDGTDYLVVWATAGICGTRVTRGGLVLDPIGFTISNAPGNEWAPSVGFNGSAYLVVWEDGRNTSLDIYGARVTQSGILIDTTGIAVSSAPDDQTTPAVSSDGNNYMVVWCGPGAQSSEIFCARVNSSGGVIDTALAVTSDSFYQTEPAVAFDGTNFLVAWQETRTAPSDIYCRRVNRNGVTVDTSTIPVSTAPERQWNPAVASGGGNCLIVWNDRRNLANAIYGARLDRAGQVLDPTGIPISTALGYKGSHYVSSNSIDYFVAWSDRRAGTPDIYGSRVSRGGVVLDTGGILISTYAGDTKTALAFDGVNFLAAWGSDGSGIVGARINQLGSVLDTSAITISKEANRQYYPCVASDGTDYLAVWVDFGVDWRGDLYGSRVSQTGTILDPGGISIAVDTACVWFVSVAFDGVNYLVAWEGSPDNTSSTQDIYAARISRSGIVLDTVPLIISNAPWRQGWPSVVFGGTNYFIAWEDERTGDWEYDVYGTRVSRSGQVLDPTGIPISTDTLEQWDAWTAFDGTNFIVAWSDRRIGTWDVYGARVNQSGVVMDPGGFPITAASNNQGRPAVDFDGSNYFVVWQDLRDSISYDIFGARVGINGVVIDPAGIPISKARLKQAYPVVAFDGSHHVVIWQDSSAGSFWDLSGAKVDKSGNLVDSFPVSLQPGHQRWPRIAKGLGSQLLVVYDGWCDSSRGRPVKANRVWGKFLPPVGIEEQADARYTIHDARLKITPNPFRWEAKIELGTGHGAKRMALRIYDVSGRMVRSFPLSTRYTLLATSTIAWDGSDDSARKLPAGVYFCRLENGETTVTQKMVKLK